MPIERAEPLVRLRYVGARFSGGRLPLDALPDLSAFRDLLRSLAKERWKAANPGRQRLPKGFWSRLSFDLIAVEEGSAVPVLQLSQPPGDPMLPGVSHSGADLLTETYFQLAATIDYAARGVAGSATSTSLLDKVRLNYFGASLRAGEKIELLGTSGLDGNVVYLDVARRKILITSDQDTYDKRVDGVGRLRGVHESGKLKIATDDFGEIEATVDSARVDEFDGNIGSNVQFTITVKLDRQDVFRGIVETLAVSLDEESDVVQRRQSRIDELRQLPPQWLEGEGEQITNAAADAASKFLQLRPELAPAFRIYPTVAGGILFEFEEGGWDLSVEMMADGKAEVTGIEINGPGEINATEFPELNAAFLAMVDGYSGRATND